MLIKVPADQTSPKSPTASKKLDGHVSVVRSRKQVAKAGKSSQLVNGADSFPEDTFTSLYASFGGGASQDGQGNTPGRIAPILEPVFKPGVLYALTTQNNILMQCIEAMEVNIDGTGHDITLIEGKKEDEQEKLILTDFFAQPYPGKNMVEIRRRLRRDVESTGNAYLEAQRNGADEVMLINDLDSHYVRLIRYDDPVEVEKTVVRAGKEVKVGVRVRERRYVQNINGKLIYFKEFGSSRDLNRETGEWAPPGQRLPLNLRASELIHFTGNKEAKTPYGLPRWLNNLPSVLGSRKAEEYNLDFFDHGGLPPVLVMVQGGYLAEEMREALEAHLQNKNGKAGRAAVVEVQSSGGTLEGQGSPVKVTVERFGTERQNDSMFQQYDQNCEEHIRISFRIAQLFLGRSKDNNFATAVTAYMVTEAQVFKPERDEFDAKINDTIVRALGVKNYKFSSRPLTLTDIDKQLRALEMVAGKYVDGEQVVNTLNDISGLKLEFNEQEQTVINPLTGEPVKLPSSMGEPKFPPPPSPEGKDPNAVGTAPGKGVIPDDPNPTQRPQAGTGKPPLALVKSDPVQVIKLADRWATVLGLNGVEASLPKEEEVFVRDAVAKLNGPAQRVFTEALAMKTLVRAHDHDQLGELCDCAAKLTEG